MKTESRKILPTELAIEIRKTMARGAFPATGHPVTECRKCSLVNACAGIACLANVNGCYLGWRFDK